MLYMAASTTELTYSTNSCEQLTNIKAETMLAFRSEILLMSQMRHPHIITLMGALWNEKMVGIVLEFASGGALDDALKSEGVSASWTWQDPKLRVVSDVAQGMNYLHNTSYYDDKRNQQVTSVLHRDLKPGNVLLMPNFTAKVADFGSSKAMTDSSNMTMTGTPIYMAPEVVRGDSYDTSADVYSFGVLMFAMSCAKGDAYGAFAKCVSGGNSKEGGNNTITNNVGESGNTGSSNAIMAKVANEEIRPEVEIASKRLQGLVKSCWQDKNEDRPTFVEILEILKEVTSEGVSE